MMMKRNTLLIVLIILAGCQSKEEKLKSKLQKTIEIYANAHKDSSFLVYDSLIILNIDTLTPKKKAWIDFYRSVSFFDDTQHLHEAQIDILKSKIKLLRLYQGFSSALYENEKSEAIEYKKKSDESLNKLINIKSMMDSLSKVAETADSVTFLLYLVKIKTVWTNKDMTISRDSENIFINKDFKVENF